MPEIKVSRCHVEFFLCQVEFYNHCFALFFSGTMICAYNLIFHIGPSDTYQTQGNLVS